MEEGGAKTIHGLPGKPLPDVSSIEEIMDAIDICDEYEIPCDDLDSIEEFIERIRLHFMKSQRAISRKQEIEEALKKASRDDEKKRQRLTEMLESLLQVLLRQGPDNRAKRNSSFCEKLLRKEGMSTDLQTDCTERKKALENTECVILVAGETSAGKSSVLNLLFEQNILPVHTKSSTSVITIVRYGRKPHAVVVYKTDRPEEQFALNEDGVKRLHKIAFMEKASERECHDIKEVRVYLPLELLQCGLVLVDSPGIGENEYLENELMDFISRTELHGFIYIVKTDNAGGVQEDRLLHLIKLVLSKQKTHSLKDNTSILRTPTFDKRAALFVCNRFDLVDAEQQERVREHVLQQLAHCWPCFDESQVVFFSTEKCRRDVEADPDYINDNYKQLLDGIRDLFITALEKRIKSTYKWIEGVLKRSQYHLKTMVRRLDYSENELRDKSSEAKQKLSALKQKADKVIVNLTNTVEEKAVGLRDGIDIFIRSEKCRNALLNDWDSAELPNVEHGLGNWPWIKEKICILFYEKLSELLEEWDRENNAVSSIEEEMSVEIKYQLNLLEDELLAIEKEIQGESSTDSSNETSYIFRRTSQTASFLRKSMQKSRFLITEPKLPFRLAGHFISPIVNIFESIRNHAHVEEYMNDPVKVANKKAEDIYRDLITQSDDRHVGIVPFVDYLLDRPREYIEALERKIPSLILSNQLLVNHFEDSIEAERANQKEYVETMMDIESLRRSLTEYGEGYIFVEDFMKGEIQVEQITPEGTSVSVAFKVSDFLADSGQKDDSLKRRDIRGLWTVTYSGLLMRNGMERPIAIKVYLPSSGMKNTFQEVAKLRCLTSSGLHVAEFLGIHHADAPTPAFVYGGDLRSIRRYLQSSFVVRRSVVCELLEDTAAALEYLHRKGLVHMELTQDTVTVDESGVVKLSGACIPRQATLPMDTETIQTGGFVYLAPEVLCGETYSACADIYSFGLLILELTQPDLDRVFNRERCMTLYDFITKLDPERMLNLGEIVEPYTIKTRALIENCLCKAASERPGMAEVVEYTFLIKDEEILSRIRNKNRSRFKVIKRPSTELPSSF